MPKVQKPKDNGILFKLTLILVSVVIILIFVAGFLAYNHIMKDKEQLTNNIISNHSLTKKSHKKEKNKKASTKKGKPANVVEKSGNDINKTQKDNLKDKKDQQASATEKDVVEKPENDTNKAQKDNLKDKKDQQVSTTEKDVVEKSENDIDQETTSPKDTKKPDNKENEEDIEIEANKNIASSTGGFNFNLNQLVGGLTKKQKTPHTSKKQGINLLNAMPNRDVIIQSPFSTTNQVIKVPEATFRTLQNEAIEDAGRMNPFIKNNADGVVLTPPRPQSKPSTTKPTMKSNVNTMSLPDIPDIPQITLPPDLSKTSQQPIIQKTPDNNIVTNTQVDSVTNVPSSPVSLEQTYLTGIIGQAAILNFGNESRALHIGQNYKGVVVLSLTDKSVTLELDGKRVIKELRDRF